MRRRGLSRVMTFDSAFSDVSGIERVR